MAGCCSALYFLNLKGDVLIQRIYRDDVECVSSSEQNMQSPSNPHTDNESSTTA